jgi:hypothetical protein
MAMRGTIHRHARRVTAFIEPTYLRRRVVDGLTEGWATMRGLPWLRTIVQVVRNKTLSIKLCSI